MTFKFAGALLRLVDYQRLLQYEATTVQGAIQALVAHYPAVKPLLLDEQVRIRKSHRLYLNGAPIDDEDMQSALTKDDCIQIVTAVAGG